MRNKDHSKPLVSLTTTWNSTVRIVRGVQRTFVSLVKILAIEFNFKKVGYRGRFYNLGTSTTRLRDENLASLNIPAKINNQQYLQTKNVGIEGK